MVTNENFIRIHLINRIIQMSVAKTKDVRLGIVIGFDKSFKISRTPNFEIFGLKPNGMPITKTKMNIGWYSFSNLEVLLIYKKLKFNNCHLTEGFI